MPRAGDRYVLPEGLGEYLVVRSDEETGGEYVEMELALPPGAFAPPAHRHPTQVEEYEVLDGSFEVMVEGEWRTLGPGESASVPVNADHTFLTVPGQRVRLRNFHRPGGRFDEFIEKQYRFATSDRFKGLRRPSTAIVMAMVWRDTPTCSCRAAAPCAGRWPAWLELGPSWATGPDLPRLDPGASGS